MNPAGRQHSIELRTWLQRPSLGLLAPAAVPGNQLDWQNPVRAKTPGLSYSLPEFQGADTFFGLAGHPQYDWQNPKGPRRAVYLLTWTHGFDVTVLSPPVVGPVGGINFQTDWPVPKGPRRPLENLTFLENLTYIIGKDFLAFSQNDWPVPRGPARAEALRTWAHNNNRYIVIGPTPLRPYEWTVPPAPRRSIELRSWLENLQQTTLKPPVFGPLGVLSLFTDWTVPRGYRGLLQGFWDTRILLLPPTPPVVAGNAGRSGRQVIPAKVPASTYRETWDFTSLLPLGETLTAAEMSVSLCSGDVDDTATFFIGLPTIRAHQVDQLLGPCAAGNTYLIRCMAVSDLGHVYMLVSFLSTSILQ
jgi:hypothetical protein